MKTTKERPSIFDPYKEEIQKYLSMGLSYSSVVRIINSALPIPATSGSLRHYCLNKQLKKNQKR